MGTRGRRHRAAGQGGGAGDELGAVVDDREGGDFAARGVDSIGHAELVGR